MNKKLFIDYMVYCIKNNLDYVDYLINNIIIDKSINVDYAECVARNIDSEYDLKKLKKIRKQKLKNIFNGE